MADPQGLAFFGTLHSLLSFELTWTPGITPNIATLTIPPQRGQLIKQGALRIQYGRNKFQFLNSRADTIQSVWRNDGTEVWELKIMDRRWLWRETGQISGFYNALVGDNHIRNPKSVRELAKLCLKEMNEVRFDVSALPKKAFPEVSWEYANPAEALASLCDQYQCYVVLGVNDRVKIAKIGVGANIPTNQILDGGITIDPPDPPGKIVFVGARNRYQTDVLLEPVGLEADGRIVPINKLSYIPVVRGRKTWQFSSVEDFSEIQDIKSRGLAQASVFRWYRVKLPFRLPGVREKIKRLWQILPMEAIQIETAKRFDGEEEPRPNWVYGQYWTGDDSHEDVVDVFEPDIDNKPRGLYTKNWALDTELGIAKFANPVYRTKEVFDRDGRPLGRITLPAKLALRTAVGLRDEKTRAWRRTEVARNPPSRSHSRKSKRYLISEDSVRERWIKFSAPAGLQDNRDEFREEGQLQIEATEAEYLPKQSGSFTLPGLIPIVVDGAIRQVTWRIDQDGVATTRVSRNLEELLVSPSYKEIRFAERIWEAMQKRDKSESQRKEDQRAKRA